MLSLLRQAASLLKHFRQDNISSPFIDLQSKLLPLLASIIILCSENINETYTNSNSNSKNFHELSYSIELLTSKWIEAKEHVPNYFHSYKEEGYSILSLFYSFIILLINSECQ